MSAVPESFSVPERLTHAEAMIVLSPLLAAFAQGCRRLDLSALREFDSSALAVLLAARRACADSPRPVITGAPDKLLRLASLYGLDGLVFDDAR